MDEVADLLNVWIETVRDYAIFLVDLGGRVASWNVGPGVSWDIENQRSSGYRSRSFSRRKISNAARRTGRWTRPWRGSGLR